MPGYKDFTDGVPLFESELDGYLMRQTVMRFATTTAMINALTTGIVEKGMLAWVDANNTLYHCDGAFWWPVESTEASFTPVFTQGGSNITYGNATVDSKWRYSGGMVKWNFHMTIGSTTNLGTGILSMSLPIAAWKTGAYLGHCGLWDLSLTLMYHRCAATLATTTSIGFSDSNSARLQGDFLAWAAGDVISVNLHYRPTDAVKLAV